MATTDQRETNADVVRRIAVAVRRGDLDDLGLLRQLGAAPEPPSAEGV